MASQSRLHMGFKLATFLITVRFVDDGTISLQFVFRTSSKKNAVLPANFRSGFLRELNKRFMPCLCLKEEKSINTVIETTKISSRRGDQCKR